MKRFFRNADYGSEWLKQFEVSAMFENRIHL